MNKEIVINKKNNIEYLQFQRLLDLFINHGFYYGNVLNFRTNDDKGDHPENFKNYEIFLKTLGMDYTKCIKANQNHSNNVLVVNDKIYDDKPDLNLAKYDDIDGLITDNKKLVLGTTSADCVLIYLYDSKKKVIGNIHSGWKGTLNNIIKNAILKMNEEYKVNSADIIACINPCIRKCCFEVGIDVYKLFKEKYPDDKFYEFKNDKWHIDLVEIIKNEMLKLNIKEDNIVDSNICSYCDKKLHSYRRDKENFGLGLAAITMEEKI